MSNRNAALNLSTRTIKIYASAFDAIARADIDEHLLDIANPHAVTAEQVGLGNADNTSDADKPISTAQGAALALKAPLDSPALLGLPTAPTAVLGTVTSQLATTQFVQAALNAFDAGDTSDDLIAAHLADLDNPHQVTKADVGLGSVDNTADLAKPVSTAQQAAINVAAAAAVAAQSDIDAHQANTSNPHAVDKVDVGLGNVANLAPADLPVSSATQTALNLKAPLASPPLTGVPTAPTAAPLTNSAQLATTAYVDAAGLVLDAAVDTATAAAAAAQADADAAQATAVAAQEDATQALADAEAATVPHRPGDAVGLYGQTKTGPADAVVPIDPAWVAVSAAGSVVRVTAATASDPQTVAPVAAYPLESGRVYEVRWRVQRQVNPADPLNDSASLGVAWLTNAKAVNGSAVIDNIALVVADGVVQRTVRIGIAPPATVALDHTAPPGTIYFRPYVDLFGDAHTTDAITIDVSDITASLEPPRVPVNIVAPASGATLTLADLRPLYVNNPAVLAALTIRLPAGALSGHLVEIGFANPVTALTIQDSAGVTVPGGPTNAYGPGAALAFRHIGSGWVYWK